MKNSNSRDKYGRTQVPASDNRLMRTANETKPPIERTTYNRPSSGKNLPPKNPTPQVAQKKQYNIEENMTVSRINEAKQGLQLLKKKMSAKGMSRQKIKNTEVKVQKPMIKTSSHKIEEDQTNNTRSNIPQRNMTKKYSEPEQTTYSKPSSNKIPKKPETNKPSNPPPQDHFDPEMEAPIKAKKDFNALLEEQLRKQRQMGGNSYQSKPAYQQPSQYPDQNDGGQLVQCRQGCGRMFNSQAISKHEKICQKVFQSKRKAFDSSAHRAPEVEGFNKPPQVATKKPQVKPAAKKPQKEQKMPKWKAQSLAFRAGLKQGKGEQLTQQQKKAMDSGPENDFVQCKFCGRKFNSTAAARHIPFCQTKSKQVPKKKR